MNRIVDASVLLAVLLDEPTSLDAVALLSDAGISTVNLSEVYRKLFDHGIPLGEAVGQVGRFQLEVVDFDASQAEEAARLRPLTRRLGSSFADRACLALATRSGLPVYTADRKWAALDLECDIRMVR